VRTKFAAELTALREELGRLAELAYFGAERAAVALVEADLTAAYEVLATDEQLQTGYAACENRAVILLALEAPVARDLRQVVSAIQIADNLSQIGWLTARIADVAVRHYPRAVAPGEVAEPLGVIARGTAALVASASAAVAAVAGPDPTTVVPDPALAELRDRLLHRLSAPDWSHGHALAVDLALTIHHYERCAQHSQRIGGLITFYHTGVPLSLQEAEE
jgi:phosphate transport system protein